MMANTAARKASERAIDQESACERIIPAALAVATGFD